MRLRERENQRTPTVIVYGQWHNGTSLYAPYRKGNSGVVLPPLFQCFDPQRLLGFCDYCASQRIVQRIAPPQLNRVRLETGRFDQFNIVVIDQQSQGSTICVQNSSSFIDDNTGNVVYGQCT